MTFPGLADQRPAGSLQFGHGVAAVDDGSAPSTCGGAGPFNSATALPPWMTVPAPHGDDLSQSLQFGHGVAAVDDRVHQVVLGVGPWPSIRPRRCRRG